MCLCAVEEPSIYFFLSSSCLSPHHSRREEFLGDPEEHGQGQAETGRGFSLRCRGCWGGCYSHPSFTASSLLCLWFPRIFGNFCCPTSVPGAWRSSSFGHSPPEASLWGRAVRSSCSPLFQTDLLLAPLEAAGTTLRITAPGCTNYSCRGRYILALASEESPWPWAWVAQSC